MQLNTYLVFNGMCEAAFGIPWMVNCQGGVKYE